MTAIATPETENLTREVVIDAWSVGVLAARIERLNRRADRLGVAKITYEVVEYGTRQATSTGYKVRTALVRIVGQTPRLDGWSFLGVIEHLQDGNLVHGDDERLAAWRLADANCDHCNISRRRNKTTIVEHQDGRLVQVGSKCVKDFLGYHSNPETLVDYVSDFYDLDGSDCGGTFTSIGFPIEAIIAATLACTADRGFVPRSARDGEATADLVAYRIGFYRTPESRRSEIAAIEITDEHYAQAAEHVAWAKALESDSNYLANLKIIANQELVSAKHLGLTCSIVAAKAKAEEREVIRRQQAEAAATSEWQGEVSGSITISGTVASVREFAGYAYNSPPSYLVVIVDADGNVYKTFNSGAFGRTTEQGETVTVKATVKAHDEYQDRKETVLTRVKAV